MLLIAFYVISLRKYFLNSSKKSTIMISCLLDSEYPKYCTKSSKSINYPFYKGTENTYSACSNLLCFDFSSCSCWLAPLLPFYGTYFILLWFIPPLYFFWWYDTCEVTGTTVKQHTQTGCFTTHAQPNSNFTLEIGSNHNMLSMHSNIPRLSDDTVENTEDSLSGFDVCDSLPWLSDPLVG